MYRQEYDVTYDDLNPTFLFTCHLKRTEPETNYHSHEFIEISIISEGCGTYYIDGQEYPVKAGDLIIMNPGTYHKSMALAPDNCTSEYYISFTDLHVRDFPPNILPLPNGQIVTSMEAGIKKETFKICSAMAKEYQSYKPGRYFMLKAYLIQMILLLLRDQKNTPVKTNGCVFESTNKKYVVKQIINYFNQHYQEKISLDQIAQNMYLSTFYISKIFKSETGDTPINYLIELRMEKALELIESDASISLQDIATQVGYDDVSHFSKLFKKHFGTAPSKYRRTI